MKRAATTLLFACLPFACLMSCTSLPPQATPPAPTSGTVTPAVQVVGQQIEFGYTTEQRVTQPFAGRWSVVRTPPWVQYSAEPGMTLALGLRAVRGNIDFQSLSQPRVTGEIVVAWTSEDGKKTGETTWPVSVNMYQVSGTTPPLQATGRDATGAVWTAETDDARAQAFIVTYRTAALQKTGMLEFSRTVAKRSLLPQVSTQTPSVRLDPLGDTRAYARHLSSADLDTLRRDPDVLSVLPNAKLRVQSTPSAASPLEPQDQYYPNQWAMRMLGYPAVWRDMNNSPYLHPVVVAVLDTGVRYDHPDLAGVLLTGADGAIDLIPREKSDDDNGVDSDPTDPGSPGRKTGSHGTHVTGIIAARWGSFAPPCAGCSGSGVAGAIFTAPVKILPVRIIDAGGTSSIAETVNGIRYAAGLPITVGGSTFINPTPAQILNLSLGNILTPETAAPLCDALAEARRRGVLAFVAAGNAGTGAVNYPAGCPDAVAVGAVTLSRSGAPEHSGFSSAYPQVQLSAPGGAGSQGSTLNGSLLNATPFPDDILSTDWDYSKNLPKYSGASGTSQATPQVAALAALMLSKGVTTNIDDTLARLNATATDLGRPGRDPQFGSGMINPAAALGAPAISNGTGLQIYSDSGRAYGARTTGNAFVSYLSEGKYTLVYGTDANRNSVYGEVGEGSATRHFTLDSTRPNINLGVLSLEELSFPHQDAIDRLP